MEKQFEEITKLVKRQGDGADLHLCKLIEEVGELAQVLNKTLGIKKKKSTDTPKAIKDNIKEEIADCIQILFGLAHTYDISYNQIKKELVSKNKSYSGFLDEKRK